jgi:hypothetical protein
VYAFHKGSVVQFCVLKSVILQQQERSFAPGAEGQTILARFLISKILPLVLKRPKRVKTVKV